MTTITRIKGTTAVVVNGERIRLNSETVYAELPAEVREAIRPEALEQVEIPDLIAANVRAGGRHGKPGPFDKVTRDELLHICGWLDVEGVAPSASKEVVVAALVEHLVTASGARSGADT
jgi:hypothetical protein